MKWQNSTGVKVFHVVRICLTERQTFGVLAIFGKGRMSDYGRMCPQRYITHSLPMLAICSTIEDIQSGKAHYKMHVSPSLASSSHLLYTRNCS